MGREIQLGQNVRDKNGYILVYMPTYYCADRLGFVYEHRFVLEQKLGRYLLEDEVPHHLNLKRDDNIPENLVAVTRSMHRQIHSRLSRMLRAGLPIPKTLAEQLNIPSNMKKYDSMRKLERNRALVEYREKHPNASLHEIGEAFNVSRERARQIIQAEKKKAAVLNQ
jgi:hypothetical protein